MDVLLNWLWQGLLVALTTLVALRALERAPASARYGVCWAAVALLIVLPAVPYLTSMSPAPGVVTSTPSGDAMVSLPWTWWTSTVFIIGAWAVWAASQAARLLTAVIATRRARAASQPFPLDCESGLTHWRRLRDHGRHTTLVVSDAVTAAAVLGCGRPLIAVAPGVLTLTAADVDCVVIHEWVHVQRRDDLVNVLQVALRTIIGWHPAFWVLDRRLQLEREVACDEATVAITGTAKSYAQCLMTLATQPRPSRAMRMAPAMSASGLRARLVRVLSTRPLITVVRARSIAASLVAVLCMLATGLGSMKIVEAGALALPLVTPRTLALAVERLDPIAVDGLSSSRSSRSSADESMTASRSTPTTVQTVSPSQSPAEAVRPATEAPSIVVDSAPSTAEDPVAPANVGAITPPPAVAPVAAEQPSHRPQRSSVAPEEQQSPWAAAAAGGVAIGRGSKRGGTATAGVFTRFAHRVASAF